MLSDEEAIRLARSHVEAEFPKTCAACGVTFATFREFLLRTRHTGQPLSQDEAAGERFPREPLGVQAFAVCECGNTIGVDTARMPLLTLWRLMSWTRRDAKRRGVSWGESAAWLRSQVDAQALAELR